MNPIRSTFQELRSMWRQQRPNAPARTPSAFQANLQRDSFDTTTAAAPSQPVQQQSNAGGTLDGSVKSLVALLVRLLRGTSQGPASTPTAGTAGTPGSGQQNGAYASTADMLSAYGLKTADGSQPAWENLLPPGWTPDQPIALPTDPNNVDQQKVVMAQTAVVSSAKLGQPLPDQNTMENVAYPYWLPKFNIGGNGLDGYWLNRLLPTGGSPVAPPGGYSSPQAMLSAYGLKTADGSQPAWMNLLPPGWTPDKPIQLPTDPNNVDQQKVVMAQTAVVSSVKLGQPLPNQNTMENVAYPYWLPKFNIGSNGLDGYWLSRLLPPT